MDPKIVALRVAVDERTQALRAAKSEDEKGTAAATLTLARADLELALATPEAATKSKYKKKTTTVEEEEEADDGDDDDDDAESDEEDEEEEEEEEESEKLPPPAAESEEEEEEEEEEEKKAKAAVASAKIALAKGSSPARVAKLKAARSHLHAVRTKAVRGLRMKLARAKLEIGSYKSLASKVQKLSASSASTKMAKAIAKAKRAGKVTPGNEAAVREFARDFGLKALRASLATMPVIGRSLGDGPSLPGLTAQDGFDMGGGGASMSQLSPEARKVVERAIAMGAKNAEGKPHTPESYAAEMVAKLRAVNGGRVMPQQVPGMTGGGTRQ